MNSIVSCGPVQTSMQENKLVRKLEFFIRNNYERTPFQEKEWDETDLSLWHEECENCLFLRRKKDISDFSSNGKEDESDLSQDKEEVDEASLYNIEWIIYP